MSDRLTAVRDLLEAEVDADRLLGAAVQVGVSGEVYDPICVGRRRLDDPSARVERDTIFLVASITKPIVVAAVMKLVEDGAVELDAPATDYVPEFGSNGKEAVTVRHLMTHTSGLPDQIPENRAYREVKRPLSDFVISICELPLAFDPGASISYQSCGIAVLGEMCERVSGLSLPDYLKQTFFDPLGLLDTALGVTRRSERESDVKIAGEGLAHGGTGTDFDWNSDYWRGFAAPWGGMLTTVDEMTRLLMLFQNGGRLDGVQILSSETVTLMLEDHSSRITGVSAKNAEQRWGLGWRLSGSQATVFGSHVSEDTFGHGGATGTLAWVDPHTGTTCVIFTNDPEAANPLRRRLSDLAAVF